MPHGCRYSTGRVRSKEARNSFACKLMWLQPHVVLFAENQPGARPSRANWSDHSAGASRNAATPMPLGSRPSTAALISPGAMNASEIVM